MSEIFKEFSETVISMGKDAKNMAVEAASQTRLKMDIRSRENYLNELYAELGRKYYLDHKDDEGVDFTEINSLLENIEELRTELDKRRGGKKCPKCGASVSESAEFCSKCGARLKGEKTEEKETFKADDVVDVEK